MYVIYCQSGKELAVVRQLADKGITAYAPRRIVPERRHRAWVRREILLFSGYVFLDLTELTPEIWQTVKFCYGTVRILSRSQLSPTEEEYIRFLCNNGYGLGISRGYVSGGVLHITDGFLKRLEHRIIKYNRRGKRATADITIYGRHYEVTLGCEIEPPASPLISSGAAKYIL